MVAFDWTSAVVGVREPRFFHVAHIFVLNDISPLLLPSAAQAFGYFVYVTHRYLF
jgi:hypothetical protein